MKPYAWILIGLLALATPSCNSFWNPSTDDELQGDQYISTETEMYTGFLGLLTRMQAVGDKEILLTDTRADLMEPTNRTNSELIAIYNYDEDLQGNSYANPAGYYELVIACNDYLENMKEYRDNPNVDSEVWSSLVASAVRIKIWTYKTLGEIYGQAYWFDDPLVTVSSLGNGSLFTLMNMEQLADQCIALLQGGYEGVNLNVEINWIAWLDPENVNDIANSSYRKWNYTVPAYAGLYAECCLWKGAYLDSRQADASSYYQTAADLLLEALGTYINNESTSGSKPYWLPNANTPGEYVRYWNSEMPYQCEAVSAIIYDYSKNQTNTLLKHFSNQYPNEYQLRPSQVGIDRFADAKFNPGTSGTGDTRYKCCFGNYNGEVYFAKFRPSSSSVRPQPYQDDVHVFTYRSIQYHLMLAEALNHLSRFVAMDGVLNMGVTTTNYVEDTPEWLGFTKNWTSSADWGTRKYYSMGLRGSLNLSSRDVKKDIFSLGLEATLRYNDMALLDEIMMEFAGEGKTYPAMNRMAVRYADPEIVASRVCPKYEGTGLTELVRASILAGNYWVNYELNLGL